MLRTLVLAAGLAAATNALAQTAATDLATVSERSGFLKTGRYDRPEHASVD